MKRYTFLTTIILIGLFASCSDESAPPKNTKRVVKYEITGNYTGKLLILYNDNVTGNTVLTDISLPWSVQITYPQNVSGIGIDAASSSVSVVGSSGQNATMRIVVNGKVEKTSTAATGSLGEITLPPLSYMF